jgi:hypothetical protein
LYLKKAEVRKYHPPTLPPMPNFLWQQQSHSHCASWLLHWSALFTSQRHEQIPFYTTSRTYWRVD